MAVISFVLLFVIFTVLFILRYKDWFLHRIKVARTYQSIPCPSGKLPVLGNIFSLPVNPYGKKKKEKARKTMIFSM